MLIRLGHFNIRDLSLAKSLDPGNPQLRAAAAIIKKFRPDILSINEMESSRNVIEGFHENFLNSPAGGEPLDYPYRAVFGTNSGLPTGAPAPFEQRGFGLYPGQYGLALLSGFPIKEEDTRSFIDYPWKSLPENYLEGHESELPEGFPLFSTNFVDAPVEAQGKTIRILLLHASIPVRGYLNRERNAAQIMFLNNYISGRSIPGVAPPEGGPFAIMGDLNADTDRGEGIRESIRSLVGNKRLVFRKTGSTFLEGGGVENPSLDPEGFRLRLDYILPSSEMVVRDYGVFWPRERDLWLLARLASDHFFLWMDVEV